MATSIAAATTEPAALDLLQHVAVLVPCSTCGQHYTVSLRDVLMSQDMLHDGCPVCHETECLPLTHAGLADETAAREFEESWIRLSRKVRAAGFDLAVVRPVLSH
jgi:hypothetical protein